MKNQWIVYVIVIIATFTIMGFILGSSHCGWSRASEMRTKVNRLRQTPRSDVLGMLIVVYNDDISLQRPEDDKYINEILNSLRRMTVVDAEECGVNYDDGQILVLLKGIPGNGVRIEGRFDPDDPNVSKSLRSDDLGKLVYKAFRHKGIKPKHE